MTRKCISIILSACLLLPACSDRGGWTLKLNSDRSVSITSPDGAILTYEPDFIILSSSENPHKQLRKGDFGFVKDQYNEAGLHYNVPTWGKADHFKANPSQHVEDGFNPEYDRAYGEGRTADYFRAGTVEHAEAIAAEERDGTVTWTFRQTPDYSLKAVLTAGDSVYPKLSFEFIPKTGKWYSIGYAGAPQCRPEDTDGIWQAHIWSEKRFPNAPFLSEAFRLPVPGTMMTVRGITNGVFADPKYIPFTNVTPTSGSSRFGAMIRNEEGKAQSMIFAPVLGNADSKMTAGDTLRFDMYLYQSRKDIDASYEAIARELCGFSDFRRNSTCNLNTTIENMTDFVQSPYAMFIDSLKGFNYSTDVPGAVKNISGLHLLETAILTDNENIFRRMARPMFEYGLSRERFLFSPDSKVKGQGTSSRIHGPGVPPSDLLATYTYSGDRIDYMLEEAVRLYDEKAVRSLNLDSYTFEDRWINSLALYKATGDRKYLRQAVKDCDSYLKTRVDTPQTGFDDKYSIGWFFWTSFTPQWMELLQMYDATGYRRYLEAAEKGAMAYTRFCWMLPTVPDGKITVNPGGNVPVYGFRNDPEKYNFMKAPETETDAWKLSEIGLTPESSGTSSGHRAIFMAHHAPFMMRIAEETGNLFLHDVARNAVIGRYECFPGYHINTGRTDVYERKDFAYRPQKDLNAHTSIHYNHIPSFLAMLWDYLFSDFYYASEGKIDFPYEYSEGYAYCRSLIYGAHPGHFYDEAGVMPYMPAGLVQVSDIQADYIAGYGNGKLYLALSNQSDRDIEVKVTFDPDGSFIDPGKEYRCKVWIQNRESGSAAVSGGEITLPLKAKGITAVAIDGVDVKTRFQEKLQKGGGKWGKNFTSTGFENDRAVLFDFGQGLKSVYVWNEADNSVFSRVSLHYSIDGGPEMTLEKSGYPYEFTVEIPDGSREFRYRLEGIAPDGAMTESGTGILRK